MAPMQRKPTIFLLPCLLLFCGCPQGQEEAAAEREKLRAELEQELRSEITRQVLAELQHEQVAAPGSRQPGSTPAAAAEPPAAATPTPPAPVVSAGSAPSPSRGADPEDLPPDPARPPVVTEIAAVPAGTAQPALRLIEATMARRVEARNPVQPGTRFAPDGDPLYAYVVVGNPDGPATWIRLVWRHGGAVFARHRLRVGQSPAWRTWAYHAIPSQQSGEWTVEIQTDTGIILRTLTFSVEP